MYVCIPHDFPTGGTDFVPTGRLPRSAREIKGDELTLGVSCENKYRCDDIIKNKHQVFLLCFLAWSLNAKACLQLTFGRTPKPNERKFHICSIPRIYIYIWLPQKNQMLNQQLLRPIQSLTPAKFESPTIGSEEHLQGNLFAWRCLYLVVENMNSMSIFLRKSIHWKQWFVPLKLLNSHLISHETHIQFPLRSSKNLLNK